MSDSIPERIIPFKNEKTYQYDPKIAAIHKLRVNVKSLAAEAKIIRKEAKRASAMYGNQLTLHRRGRLREEARIAQLALAYVRGRTYLSVERKSKIDPKDLTMRVGEKLQKFGVQLVAAGCPWFADVRKWLEAK